MGPVSLSRSLRHPPAWDFNKASVWHELCWLYGDEYYEQQLLAREVDMTPPRRDVVVVGGGFGGLWATQSLSRADLSITLVDRQNYHLFQPLLYQVATGALSPADIASPLRAVLSRRKNVRVVKAEVKGLDPNRREIELDTGFLSYSYLVLATGATHHYFGNDEWQILAPGLKTIDDATTIRNRILDAFEQAEREVNPHRRNAFLTFVIVGGGPTGVEMAGAVGELARQTLRKDFRSIDPRDARILLAEGLDRVLPSYPEALSRKAARSLERLGVEIRSSTFVSAIEPGMVTFTSQGTTTTEATKTVIWAAGLRASTLGGILSARTGAALDKFGRVVVRSDCSVPGHPEIFVIGDLACFVQNARPLPGVASVAMQQGTYVGRAIEARVAQLLIEPFRYIDKGRLAVIGRAEAVAEFGRFGFSGCPAWILWVFVHLMNLVGFENRALVLLQWAWSYVTRNRSARLITACDVWTTGLPPGHTGPDTSRDTGTVISAHVSRL